MPKQGYITPSKFSAMLKRGRSKEQEWGDTALGYADEIVLDILGVERPEQFTTYEMQWGLDNEWGAEQAYQDRTMSTIVRPDFIQHQKYEFIGGHPDGLVGTDGIVEIKCPYNSKYHLQNLIDNAQFVEDYQAQIQGYLFITGRQWCDCISFDPRFPEALQLAVHRVMRDDAYIQALEERAVKFWDIVQKRLAQVAL